MLGRETGALAPRRTSPAPVDSPNGNSTTLDRLLYTDIKTYLVELLMKQDQMSMSTSIESRVPFLDHVLVEFAARPPERMKLSGFTTKRILREAVRDILHANRQISVDGIQETVAEYFKIKLSDMHSKKRSRAIARPRQVAMALAKELTQLSLPEIGSNFGGRDHTTVLHACRQIAKLRESHPDLNHDVNFLLQVLRS